MKGKKMNWGKTFVLTLVLSSTPVSIAWADDSEAKKNEALALYDEAKVLAKSAEWANAEQKLLAAQQAFATPKTAGMLGFVQVQRGNYLEGVRNLEWFFQEDTTVEAEKREQVRPQYVLAKKNVATIKLKVDPIDAVVSIDGAAIPSNQLHWPHYVGAGTHSIEAKKEGFGLERQSVTVAIGMETPVELKLVAVSKPGEGPKEKPVIGPKPVKMLPLVLAAWIGGGVFGAVAIGTGIGAAARSGDVAAAKKRAQDIEDQGRGSCDDACLRKLKDAWLPVGGLSWISVTSGVLAAGCGIFAITNNWRGANKKNSALAAPTILISPRSISVVGAW